MADYTIELTAQEYEAFKNILKKAKKVGAVVKNKQLPTYVAIFEKMRSHSSWDRNAVIDICGKMLTDQAARDSVMIVGSTGRDSLLGGVAPRNSEWHRLYAKFGLKRWDGLEAKFAVSSQLDKILNRVVNLGYVPSVAAKHRYRRNTVGHQLAILWDYLMVAGHGVDQYLQPHIRHSSAMPKQRWKHRVSWQRFYVDLTLGLEDPANESLGSLLCPGSDSYVARNRDLKSLLFLLGRAYVMYQRNLASLSYNFHSDHSLIEESGPHLLVVDGSTGHPIITKRLKNGE
jgi:hypothetical protein